jgi:Skp family chaperone for outer membrane proteins
MLALLAEAKQGGLGREDMLKRLTSRYESKYKPQVEDTERQARELESEKRAFSDQYTSDMDKARGQYESYMDYAGAAKFGPARLSMMNPTIQSAFEGWYKDKLNDPLGNVQPVVGGKHKWRDAKKAQLAQQMIQERAAEAESMMGSAKSTYGTRLDAWKKRQSNLQELINKRNLQLGEYANMYNMFLGA